MSHVGDPGPQGDNGPYNMEVSRRIKSAVEARRGKSLEVQLEAIHREMLAMTDSDKDCKV